MSEIENILAVHLDAIRPGYCREYRFAAMHTGGTGKGVRARLQDAGMKDWRFDFAYPEIKLAIEVEGGGWVQGRHNRGKGFHEDLIKYGKAMGLGWNVYRCDGQMVKGGEAIKTIRQIIEMIEMAI